MTLLMQADLDTPIHRLNPVTKLVALLSIIVIVFAIPRWWAGAIVVLAVIVPAALLARSLRRLLATSGKVLVPIVVILTIVQGFLYPGGRTPIFHIGAARVTVEGLLFALYIGCRIICLVLSAVLMVLTTHPGDLMAALTERGMSPKFSYIISSTLQLIPSFNARANGILLAQQARGMAIPRNRLRRVGTMMPLLAPLLLGLFTDVEERSTAMEARGFGSPAKRTSLIPVPDTLAQRIWRWIMAAIAVGAVVLPIVVVLP